MLDRCCPQGCTQECADIWDERSRELQASWARRIARDRQERARRHHELANSGGHRSSMQPLSGFLDPDLWVGQDPPRRRSRMLALGEA